MIRLGAGAPALALFVLAVLTAPIRPVALIGLAGLLLAAVGIAAHWRWPVTAGACIFLTDYTAALLTAGGPVSVAGAAGFGLALLLLLQAADLARRVHRATVGAGVVRSQLARWIGLGAATLATTLVIVALAGAFAASVPFAAAPLLAAAGALGAMLALAMGAFRAAARRDPGPPPA
jgi:hypothetical protein